MNRLTAKFLRSYSSKASGERRAIYTVNGPTKELEAYKAFQGSYGVDDVTNNAIIFADAPINMVKDPITGKYTCNEIFTVQFSEELNRYWVDFTYLQDVNASISTAKKRLDKDLTSEIIRMKAVELTGAPRSIAAQSAEAPEAAKAASESSDFDKEIEG